jgi:acyl carrier protein
MPHSTFNVEFYRKLDELLELHTGTLTGREPLNSLEEWDSLAVVGFIAMVDRTYGVIISPTSIVACRTVDDLAGLLRESGK